MFYKVKKLSGIVYVIRMELDSGEVVYKVGITTRKIEDRLAEILIGVFKYLRYVPRTSVRRFSKSERYEWVERELLDRYADKKYEWGFSFGGSTEFVCGVEEEELLEVYDSLMKV